MQWRSTVRSTFATNDEQCDVQQDHLEMRLVPTASVPRWAEEQKCELETVVGRVDTIV